MSYTEYADLSRGMAWRLECATARLNLLSVLDFAVTVLKTCAPRKNPQFPRVLLNTFVFRVTHWPRTILHISLTVKIRSEEKHFAFYGFETFEQGARLVFHKRGSS